MVKTTNKYPDTLEQFRWYKSRQGELVEQYNNKYLLICGNKVCGVYDTIDDAADAGEENYTPGKFIVQRCSSGKDTAMPHIATPFIILQ
jgi:hypothetical protein